MITVSVRPRAAVARSRLSPGGFAVDPRDTLIVSGGDPPPANSPLSRMVMRVIWSPQNRRQTRRYAPENKQDTLKKRTGELVSDFRLYIAGYLDYQFVDNDMGHLSR